MAVYKYVTSSELDRVLIDQRSFRGVNSNPFQIPPFRVGAFKADGSIALADATNPSLQRLVGVSDDDVPAGFAGRFVQSGTLSGAIAGLGATSGDTIYLGLVAGTLATAPPSGLGVAQIVVGYAQKSPTTGLVDDLRVDLGGVSSTSGGSGGSGVIEIQCFNDSGVLIEQNKVVAWNDAGTVLLASSQAELRSDAFGVMRESTLDQTYGPVQFSGIVPDICAPLNPVAGQPIFLGVGGNLSLTTSSNPAHSAVRIGYAIVKSGTAGPATDLLLDVEVLMAANS